jgi:hypothetical protein
VRRNFLKITIFLILFVFCASLIFAVTGTTTGSLIVANTAPTGINAFNLMDADSNCEGDSWDGGDPALQNYSTHFLNVTFNFTIADDVNNDTMHYLLCVGSDYTKVAKIGSGALNAAAAGSAPANANIRGACDVVNAFNISDNSSLHEWEYTRLSSVFYSVEELVAITPATENQTIDYSETANTPNTYFVVAQVWDNQTENNVSSLTHVNISIGNMAPYWSTPGDSATGFTFEGNNGARAATALETHNKTPNLNWDDVLIIRSPSVM